MVLRFTRFLIMLMMTCLFLAWHPLVVKLAMIIDFRTVTAEELARPTPKHAL